ncbi:MAG: AAA family ATPase [Thermoprotei archaeon]
MYVFLDEFQKLPGWAGQLKLIYDSFQNLKLLASGSASLNLEQGAINNLAGRYFVIEASATLLPNQPARFRGIVTEVAFP